MTDVPAPIEPPKSNRAAAAARRLLAQARNPAFWRALLLVAAGAGIALSPDAAEKVAAFGPALADVIGLFVGG